MSKNLETFTAAVTIESVRKQVENGLRKAIVQGRFPPRTHLSDRLLQETFQVSRTVIREAVRQVEAEGLIETIPHRGSFVKQLTVREAEQVYAVRGVLEGLAARECARNASDEQVAELERVVERIRKHHAKRQTREIVDLKHEFYDVLMQGSGNTHIKTMLAPLLNINAQLRATSMSVPDRLPHTVAELGVIVAAIKARDEKAAHAASVRHVENAAAVALRLLRQRDAAAAEAPAPAPAPRRKAEVPVKRRA